MNASFYAMMAWLGSIDRDLWAGSNYGGPAYRPKRKKIKGYQKGKKAHKRNKA